MTKCPPRTAIVLIVTFCLVSLATVAAHVVKSLTAAAATAFVSSPSAGGDAPIKLVWGDPSTGDTGIRAVCFNVANTSAVRVDRPDFPRVTAVGFELPGSSSGFSLLSPLDESWKVVEGVTTELPDLGTVTLDFVLVARTNPTGITPGSPREPRGIPPGQPGVRGSGTRFCVSGPFPDLLPDLSTADPEDTVATTIEGLLNGVVVTFRGATGNGAGSDLGVWFPPPGTAPRPVPLYP